MVGFNLDNKEKKYGLENRINTWVRLFSRVNNEPIIGYLRDINHYNAILKPYARIDYNENGVPFYKIEKNQSHEFPKNLIGNHEKSSKKSAKNFCKYMNKKFNLDSIKNEKEELGSLFEINRMKYEISKEQITSKVSKYINLLK